MITLREPYPNELYHHGIKGQKWGVRRYQNPDGSLTTAGRIRYGRKKFPQIAGKTFADSIYNVASRKEPQITKDVTNAIQSSGGKMYGLEHRLKTRESINRKIHTDSQEKGISLADAAKDLKDAVRYTSIADDNGFVSSYLKTKRSLEQKGYTEVRCRNYFDMYAKGEAKHKSVQCVYEDKNGYKFEIQFHTPSSQKAKDLKVPIYEERRKPGNSNKRNAELEQQMDALARDVTTPKDIDKIKTH